MACRCETAPPIFERTRSISTTSLGGVSLTRDLILCRAPFRQFLTPRAVLSAAQPARCPRLTSLSRRMALRRLIISGSRKNINPAPKPAAPMTPGPKRLRIQILPGWNYLITFLDRRKARRLLAAFLHTLL